MNNFDFNGRIVSFGIMRLQNGNYAQIKSGQQGLRQTQKGKHFIRFTVAIDRKHQRDQNGNKIADYPKMIAWGKTADYVSIMNAGDSVIGSAGFHTGSFVGRDNKRHYTWGFTIGNDKISRVGMSKTSQAQYQQHKQASQGGQPNNMFGGQANNTPFGNDNGGNANNRAMNNGNQSQSQNQNPVNPNGNNPFTNSGNTGKKDADNNGLPF